MSLLSAPPVISVGQSEMSVIQGFQALLPCAAQGLPEPRVSWEKQGVPVPTLPGKFTLLRSGELIIERAEVSLVHIFTKRLNYIKTPLNMYIKMNLLNCFMWRLVMQVSSPVWLLTLLGRPDVTFTCQSTWDLLLKSYLEMWHWIKVKVSLFPAMLRVLHPPRYLGQLTTGPIQVQPWVICMTWFDIVRCTTWMFSSSVCRCECWWIW